jgi:hypothetical protein
MTEWKILIPAKVTENGSFDTSNLLTIEQFNSFKNSDLKDIKKEIKDLKDRPTTSVDTSKFVSSELFNDYKSSNEQNITSLKEKVQVLENKEIPNTSDFVRNSTFNEYKEWVNGYYLGKEELETSYLKKNDFVGDLERYSRSVGNILITTNNFETKFEYYLPLKAEAALSDTFVTKQYGNSTYALKSELPTTQFNADNYYVKNEVDSKIKNVKLPDYTTLDLESWPEDASIDFKIGESGYVDEDYGFSGENDFEDKIHFAILKKLGFKYTTNFVTRFFPNMSDDLEINVNGKTYKWQYGADTFRGDIDVGKNARNEDNEYRLYFFMKSEDNKYLPCSVVLKITPEFVEASKKLRTKVEFKEIYYYQETDTDRTTKYHPNFINETNARELFKDATFEVSSLGYDLVITSYDWKEVILSFLFDVKR